MQTPNITELSLRAAVNSKLCSRNLNEGASGNADAIKNTAISQIEKQTTPNSGLSALTSQISSQSAIVEAAVVGIAVAYTAVSQIMANAKNKRLIFDRERAAGIATMMIPNNQEEAKLSYEEKFIKGFIELVDKSSFSSYLGIHSADLTTDTSGKFYSVLPFYQMSSAIEQPVGSKKKLDIQRTRIGLFLKSAFPKAISKIDVAFQNDWQIKIFFQSFSKDYLKNRSASRFVMTCLANLLWNLKQPVVPGEGFALNVSECITLCSQAEEFLNTLLNESSPYYPENLNNKENNLIGFLRKIEIYIKTLRKAYVEEQLHELNINDITNSAHRALRIMDVSLWKLIYKRFDPIARKEVADGEAAEELADTISYLNLLLEQNTSLIENLRPVPSVVPPDSMINYPPSTIVDVLILFCHLSYKDRHEYLKKIESNNTTSSLLFADALKDLDKKFIKPIRALSRKELGKQKSYNKIRDEEIGILTAKRLVPLITLVMEDYRLEGDTQVTKSKANAAMANLAEATDIRYSGNMQIRLINQSAERGDGYYEWKLSFFIGGTKELDDLPLYQYKMTGMAKLLDYVAEIVKSYRSFLLQDSFQKFLVKLINNVMEGYSNLSKLIEAADLAFSVDTPISRDLKAIVSPMMTNLGGTLASFNAAMRNFEKIISDPDFTERERLALAEKLSLVAKQYREVFSNDDDELTNAILKLGDTPSLITSPQHLILAATPQRTLDYSAYADSSMGGAPSCSRQMRVRRANRAQVTLLGHQSVVLSRNSSNSSDPLSDLAIGNVGARGVGTPRLKSPILAQSLLGGRDLTALSARNFGAGFAQRRRGEISAHYAETPQTASSTTPDLTTKPLMQNLASYDKENMTLALIFLVDRCNAALSYQSKLGRKGLLLRELKDMINATSTFEDEQVKHILMELIRVTASYQVNFGFFHAAYGETRSSLALIAAMKERQINKYIPIAKLIFDKEKFDVSKARDGVILRQINKLCRENHWHQSCEKLHLHWPKN